MRLLIFVNRFLYTKSYPNKYLCLIFIIVLYSSCSPTAYILEKQPKVGSSIYSKKIKNIQNKILKSNSLDINLLQKGVQELTMYSYGFLIEESDSMHTISSWDSLNHISIILEIEKKVDYKFSPIEISQAISIENIYNIINSKK